MSILTIFTMQTLCSRGACRASAQTHLLLVSLLDVVQLPQELLGLLLTERLGPSQVCFHLFHLQSLKIKYQTFKWQMALHIFVSCTFIKMMDFQHLANHNAELKDDKTVTDVSTYLDRF